MIDQMIQHDMQVTLWALRFAVVVLFGSIGIPAIMVWIRHVRRSRGRIGLKELFAVVAAVAAYLTICVLLWHSVPTAE